MGSKPYTSGAATHILALNKSVKKHSEPCSEPSSALTSAGLTLASRWLYMIGQSSASHSSFEVFSSLIRDIPVRIGSDIVFDAAVTYVLDSYCLFKKQGRLEVEVASKAGVKAFRALRESLAVQSPAKAECKTIMMSMMLHIVAQVSSWTGSVQARALTEIVASFRRLVPSPSDAVSSHQWPMSSHHGELEERSVRRLSLCTCACNIP